LDVIVGVTTNAVQAAKQATRTIAFVLMGVSDPIAAELVESLARPGGNLTGFTNIAPVLSGIRLELLKETVPKLFRVAVLWDSQSPGSVPQWKETEVAAAELGLQLYSMEVSSADKYEGAFKDAIRARSDAIAVTLNPVANSNQKPIAVPRDQKAPAGDMCEGRLCGQRLHDVVRTQLYRRRSRRRALCR